MAHSKYEEVTPATQRVGPLRGVYIHIPFCKTLCPYCDFVKVRAHTGVPSEYCVALCTEIVTSADGSRIGSIFFGGGTPSLLLPQDLEQILNTLAQHFRLEAPEITLEANPDDVTRERVRIWQDVGINRISLGVQSFDDTTLRYLGRRHDASRARYACEWVAEVFASWNLDLIYGAPPVNAYEHTLAEVIQLRPPHVSAYALSYEPETPFYSRRHEAISEDESLRLYQMTEAALSDYTHYEISNFALPGYACRHNLIYWRNEEYFGFGTGAFGYLAGVRMRNTPSVQEYLRQPGKKSEQLSLDPLEIKVETLIQHFRLREGIAKDYYQRRFGTSIEADFGEVLDDLERRGLVTASETHYRPTPEGFYLNNEIGLALVEKLTRGDTNTR